MNQTRQERSQSYFYALRKFHNDIKRTMFAKYTKGISNLLEIGSGKSGDIAKAIDNNVKNIVGYDINESSINEGKRRVAELKKKSRGKFPNVTLYVKDLSRSIIKHDNQFDVVSAQFCFHYFFESKETFDTVMQSIENNLKVGGYFIGTTFNGTIIKELLVKHQYTLIDEKGSTRFKLSKVNSENFTDSMFGNKLSVFMKDTVLDEPMDEYLVYFSTFVKEMKARGFELIESESFGDLYNDKFAMNELSKRISFLNRTFVFKYLGVPPKLNVQPRCKQETSYLVECLWGQSRPISDNIMQKYKKALAKKMEDTTDVQAKGDYKYIIENFDDAEKIMNEGSSVVKAYFSVISKLYSNT